MERVLVTGANGFVGNHLVKELANSGMEVIGVGGSQGNAEPSPYIKSYVTLDLNDTEAVGEIDFTDVHGVLHLAGLAAVGPSFDNPLQYIQTNIGIEINLFEAALKQNTHPKFIIISSGSLYDPKTVLPLTESSAILPNSPYAVSKLGQEQMAQYYAQRNFEVVIARPFNHIGPGQNPGFIVPDLAQQVVAVERGEANEILVGNLDAKRDYTDVRDIARAYRLLLEKGVSGEAYNVCSGRSLSGHEILAAILITATASPVVTEDPTKMRPSDASDIYGDYEKLCKDTGWKPKVNLEQTMQDVIADWRTR